MAGNGRTIFEREASVLPKKSGSPKGDQPGSDAETLSGAGTDPRKVKEIGGPKGPEPTRYGDWEKGGRCSDF